MSTTAKRIVASLRGGGRKQSTDSGGSQVVGGRLVAHGGTAATRGLDDSHELDEIAVVSSNADPCHVKYGSGPLPLSTINGPRLVPGKLQILYLVNDGKKKQNNFIGKL